MSVSGLCRIARKLVFGNSVYKIVNGTSVIKNLYLPVNFQQNKNLHIMPPKRKRNAASGKETKTKAIKKVVEYDQSTDDEDVTAKPTRKGIRKEMSDDSDKETVSKTNKSKKTPKAKEAVGDQDVKDRKNTGTDKDDKSVKGRKKAESKSKDVAENDNMSKRKRNKAESEDSSDEEDVKPPTKARKNTKTEKTSTPAKNKTSTEYEEINFDCTKKSANGKEWNYKISNWNVDGIRAWLKKGGLDYINYEKPDVLCLQETKCSLDKLPSELKEIDGYKAYWQCSVKDGYAGVGLFSKTEPLSVKYGLDNEEHDDEGRIITAEYDKFYVISVYVPNAGRGLVTLPKRLKWNDDFQDYVAELDKKKPVIVCGDMNVAHLEIDLANPKTNTKNAGFTKEERDGMTDFLSDGYIDTFRELYPEKTQAYTFWTYMANCRAKNVGWRLDYFIVSERFMNSVCDNVIRNEVFGSDHCPITLFLNV